MPQLEAENIFPLAISISPPEAKEEEKIWRLMKPVCGLDDACRNFYCIVLVLQLAVVFIL